MSHPTTTIREGGPPSQVADLQTGGKPDNDVQAPATKLLAGGPLESLATTCALLLCVIGRLPHRVLDATGLAGWAVSLVVVVVVVNGVRMLVRTPFALDPSLTFAKWAKQELRQFGLSTAVGALLTVPLYGLLRSTSTWWLLAWALFAAVTVAGLVAMPLTLRAQSGPLFPADARLTERVQGLGRRAGVDVGRGVLVAGKAGSPGGNAYVVGLGPTRRVVLDAGTAAWPPELVDQVVAHELGHWRLGHTARRLPLTLLSQLATLAAAAWILSLEFLLNWAGVASFGDPRSYPVLLLLTPLLALPARCLLAWNDRAQERSADRFALDLLDQPGTFAAMLERAKTDGGAAENLSWWRRLTASHPPISERAAACTRFASTA